MTAYNRNTLIVGLILALAVAGGVSYFASSSPDGLEKAQEELGVTAGQGEPTAASPLADYTVRGLPEGFASNAIAGVAGTLLILGLLLGLGRLLSRNRSAAAAPSPGRSHRA